MKSDTINIPHDKFFFFIFIAIFLFWFLTTYTNANGAQLTPAGDYARDTAITYNLLAGNVLGDAAYKGELAWYPFLMHSIYALINRITGVSVQTLFASYSVIGATVSLLLISWCFYKISHSAAYTSLAVFSLLYLMPWTNHEFSFATHPIVLAMGTTILGIYLFWRAVSRATLRAWVIAGVGIGTVIYSQTLAAMTLCGGIVLYQLLTRKNWKGFLYMVGTSFLVASPYIVPLIFRYHLIPKNPYGVGYVGIGTVPLTDALDFYFYGFGITRFINSLFIIVGLVFSLIQRKKLDLIFSCMFLFGLGIELIGVGRLYGLGPSFVPVFVPHDFAQVNHVIAIFFLTRGLWVFLGWVKTFAFPKQSFGMAMLLLTTICLYAIVLLPGNFDRLAERRVYLLAGNTKEPDWYAATQWIWTHTAINNVILATPDRSYFYISGLTGRKVVATHNEHASAFVDQKKRVEDALIMYQTTDMERFKKLVLLYQVDYVVVSSYEEQVAGAGALKFNNDQLFGKVFSTDNLTIYKIRR